MSQDLDTGTVYIHSWINRSTQAAKDKVVDKWIKAGVAAFLALKY